MLFRGGCGCQLVSLVLAQCLSLPVAMKSLNDLVHTLITLRQSERASITLLAVCPNSKAVLEAAVKTAASCQAPMLFAATLNQVDTDGGYTGWTPAVFVQQMRAFARKYNWDGPLYPCLDHGGPWLKDRHTSEHYSLDETMAQVKNSLEACLEAGYQLLHIDPTVDRSLSPGETVPLEVVVERTVELMTHAEQYRLRRSLPAVAYEVGTEEVHGGLVDEERFEHFLKILRVKLETKGLGYAWPCFVVAQVGTDLHTTFFDPAAARRLYATLAPLGSLAKGHYTDWVANPEAYPASGMGGANVGPEFTAAEYQALRELEAREGAITSLQAGRGRSHFMERLQQAVIESGRWMKWLQAAEKGSAFWELSPDRQEWLVQTGSRYIWTAPDVVSARQQLYENLLPVMPDPHRYVVEAIGKVVEKYIRKFNLLEAKAWL
jgi:D-tagatose-1,6-bisphosphate aldolase subunit GatZ/KbaZ